MPRSRPACSLREITMEPGIAPQAAGSVLVAFGNTQVICAASVEEGVPRWMKEQGISGGWITAEYSMLPYSTSSRKARDAVRGKQDGRSVEIQRLIGRSLRAVVNLKALGSRTLWVDCDVLQADGGTRTAAISGACVAICLAAQKLMAEGKITQSFIDKRVAAISMGIVEGKPLLDLDYEEDRAASVDMNLVMTESLELVEVQASGEEAVFSREELSELLKIGEWGVSQIFKIQGTIL